MNESRRETQTGGREATAGHIAGDVALAVGYPHQTTPTGFLWRRLTDLARLESGHTPSRRVPEYWDGGTLPWISTRDATENHGRTIYATRENITEVGEQNSSTRLLPANTVCLSRTASVGFVVVMGLPMCTSQDFVNWVCGPDLDHRYLKYLLLAEREAFLRFASGTTHQTVYFPEVKAFHVMVPDIQEQRAIASVLGALDDKIESDRRLARVAQDLARSELERVCADSSSRVAVRDVVRSVHERRKSDNPTFPYIGLEHFNGFDLALWRYGKAADTTSAVKVCESGDLVFGRIRPYFGNVALAGQAAIVAQSIEVLRPIRENDLEAVFLRLSSREFIDAATTISSGTTMPQVKWTDLEAEEIVVPTPDRMIQFRMVAAPLFELLKRLPSEVENLASIRNSLLPELLSGRLRVRDAEKVLEGAV